MSIPSNTIFFGMKFPQHLKKLKFTIIKKMKNDHESISWRKKEKKKQNMEEVHLHLFKV